MIDAEQTRAIAELCSVSTDSRWARAGCSRVRALTPVDLVANLEERFRY